MFIWGLVFISEFFTISFEKNKIMKHPKELLKKCWRDPWDEKDNTDFTTLERKLACTIFYHLFQLEVGTAQYLVLELYFWLSLNKCNKCK